MTNQASLFVLCKEVYKRTGWDGDKQFAYDDTYGDKWLRHIAEFPHKSREWRLENMIPLYTSDYLLEKLPYKIGEANSAIWLRLGKTRNGFTVCYMGSDLVCLHECEADTPILALLKLTIALSEAGELK